MWGIITTFVAAAISREIYNRYIMRTFITLALIITSFAMFAQSDTTTTSTQYAYTSIINTYTDTSMTVKGVDIHIDTITNTVIERYNVNKVITTFETPCKSRMQALFIFQGLKED